MQKLIDQVAALPGGGDVTKELDKPSPIELWVDGDDRVRRIKQDTKVPAQQGVPAGAFKMTMDYSDFGTPLDIDRPEGDEVWDATAQIKKALPPAPPARSLAALPARRALLGERPDALAHVLARRSDASRSAISSRSTSASRRTSAASSSRMIALVAAHRQRRVGRQLARQLEPTAASTSSVAPG